MSCFTTVKIQPPMIQDQISMVKTSFSNDERQGDD